MNQRDGRRGRFDSEPRTAAMRSTARMADTPRKRIHSDRNVVLVDMSDLQPAYRFRFTAPLPPAGPPILEGAAGI